MAWLDFDLPTRTPPQNVTNIESKRLFCDQLMEACVRKGHISFPKDTSRFIDKCARGLPNGTATRTSPVDNFLYTVFPRGSDVIARSVGSASHDGIRHAMQVSASNLAEPRRCRFFSKDDGPGGNAPAIVTEAANEVGANTTYNTLAATFDSLGVFVSGAYTSTIQNIPVEKIAAFGAALATVAAAAAARAVSFTTGFGFFIMPQADDSFGRRNPGT